jgi:glycolate oxidase
VETPRLNEFLGHLEGLEMSRQEAVLETFSRDESQLEAARPEVVIFAKSTQDVARCLMWANKFQIPVTPVGARSGKSGGSLCVAGGVALSLSRMDQVLNLNAIDRTLTAQPGVILDALKARAEQVGLWYPPDPNSAAWCTLGGTIAENAGGPCALKYGVTGHYVLSMEWVTPQGDIVRVGAQTHKGVAGYNLVQLFVGSEGTLGVCTEATLKLIPKPAHVITALFQFRSMAQALAMVSSAMTQGAWPRCVELLDETALRVAALPEIASTSQAVLIVECDGSDEAAVLSEMDLLRTLGLNSGALEPTVAQSAAQREAIWQVRRNVSLALKTLKRFKLSEDIVIPISRLAEAIESIKALGRSRGLLVATYGHAGDGNLHTNVLFDDPSERPTVEKLLTDIMKLTVDLGGTITGEHGVGSAKRAHLRLEQSPQVIDIQTKMKQLFDPKGILNPHKIF